MDIYEAKELERISGSGEGNFGPRTYAQVVVELPVCGSCARPMLPERRGWSAISPRWGAITLEEQARRAGWPLASGMSNTAGQWVCRECAAAGKAKFLCALCGEERPHDQTQESFGDPPEFLCRVCYETRTAATYETKRRALSEAHRWDFE